MGVKLLYLISSYLSDIFCCNVVPFTVKRPVQWDEIAVYHGNEKYRKYKKKFIDTVDIQQ